MEVNKETLHQIINTLADPVFVKDRDHRFVFLNDACCELIGRPRADLIGRSDYDFFPKEQADIFWRKDEEVFKTGLENLNEETITDANKIVHTIVTKKSLYVDSESRPFIVGIIRDVTDRKQAERSRFDLTRAQAEREQLELFAYVASHDLREPLQSITGFSDLLHNRYGSSLDASGQGYLKRIQEAALRMSHLIDALLKFSKVVKRADLFSLVDLSKVLPEVLEDLEFQIKKEKAQITVGKLPMLYGDEMQLRQLFQNLLTNALKFHPPGRVPEVSILSRDMGDKVEIALRDNGIGIQEKYLERIFRPFERLHSRTEFEGSGVGLAICQKIVSHHEGQIHVRSTPGEGSTFYIVLPKAHQEIIQK